ALLGRAGRLDHSALLVDQLDDGVRAVGAAVERDLALDLGELRLLRGLAVVDEQRRFRLPDLALLVAEREARDVAAARERLAVLARPSRWSRQCRRCACRS